MASADYIPREDVKVIVCANQSPYEFFGKYDPKLQRKMMPQDWVTQLEQRVHYVRLDGEGEATRRQFMHVTGWSEDEFRQELNVMCYVRLVSKVMTMRLRPRNSYSTHCNCTELELHAAKAWKTLSKCVYTMGTI
jgi:hypothetical protein